MNLTEALNSLPNTKGCVIILSGGMDSTIAMRLAVEKYGPDNVKALTFDYGQKQKLEIQKARESTAKLGVKHLVLDLSALGQVSMGLSANVDPNIKVPDLEEVLGDPLPRTYIPNRNLILLAYASAYAQANGVETILCGIQIADEYGYFDATQAYIDDVNRLFAHNRTYPTHVIGPFANLSKTNELELLLELDGNVDLLKHTLTCYNPDEHGRSCGRCATCRERMKAFKTLGLTDPIEYQN